MWILVEKWLNFVDPKEYQEKNLPEGQELVRVIEGAIVEEIRLDKLELMAKAMGIELELSLHDKAIDG